MWRLFLCALAVMLACACLVACDGNWTPTATVTEVPGTPGPTSNATTQTETPRATLDLCQEVVNLWTITNWAQSAFLDVMPTLQTVRTRVAQLESTVCATLAVQTRTPEATPTPAPTATEATNDALCRTCVKNDQTGYSPKPCPPGYACASCGRAGLRCVRQEFIEEDCQRCLGTSAISTTWTACITWYGEPYEGRKMANGQTYHMDALTCAVPAQRWNELAGRVLRVCVDRQCVDVTVTDTFFASWHRLDLSKAAFARLADPRLGVVTGIAGLKY